MWMRNIPVAILSCASHPMVWSLDSSCCLFSWIFIGIFCFSVKKVLPVIALIQGDRKGLEPCMLKGNSVSWKYSGDMFPCPTVVKVVLVALLGILQGSVGSLEVSWRSQSSWCHYCLPSKIANEGRQLMVSWHAHGTWAYSVIQLTYHLVVFVVVILPGIDTHHLL